MKNYKYITLKQMPLLREKASKWFSSKWNVPIQSYLECMDAYLNDKTDNGWYLCLDGNEIVAGLGVMIMIFIIEKTYLQIYVLYIQKKSIEIKELLANC